MSQCFFQYGLKIEDKFHSRQSKIVVCRGAQTYKQKLTRQLRFLVLKKILYFIFFQMRGSFTIIGLGGATPEIRASFALVGKVGRFGNASSSRIKFIEPEPFGCCL